jgi:uncharacterized membrane protein YkvA (DUF1232 family)
MPINMSLSIIEDLKSVYKIIYRLLAFPESDWKTKIYASTAIAYLINPYDVIPEAEKGEEGYIDDLYVCLLVLRDLYTYRKDLVELANEEEINIEELLNKLDLIKKEILDEIEQIEKVSGYDSLNKFDIANSQVDSRISKQIKQDSTILGIIAFFYDELINIKKNYEEYKGKRRNSLSKKNNFKRKIRISYHDNPFIQDLKESGEFFDVKRLCSQYHNSGIVDLTPSELNSRVTLFMDYEVKLKDISTESPYYNVIKYAPHLFKTLCNIAGDENCPWNLKHEVNSALTYFLLEDDVIEDSIESGLGFVDDIFVASFVLFDISERDPELLIRNLVEELSHKKIMEIFQESSYVVDKEIGQIINLLGLKGLMTFLSMRLDDNLDFTKCKRVQSSRLKVILSKMMDLYFDIILYFDRKSKIEVYIEKIIEALEENEKTKLQKFIELAHDSSYHKNIKVELDKQESQEIKLLILKHKILSS